MGAEMTGHVSLNATADEIAEKWSGRYVFETHTGIEYAAYVEFGTKRHDITPDTAGALHFWVDGVEVITTYVDHPGATPSPYMQPAAEGAARSARRAVAASDDLEGVAENLAEIVKDLAQHFAPVKSGRLVASIKVTRVS